MPTSAISSTLNIGGMSMSSQINRTATGVVSPQEIVLPAGKAGTLTTRTSDTVGIATLAQGHGFVQGDIVDIFWLGGRRYGVLVNSVTSTTVSFGTTTPGNGDVLPIATTALVMTEQVTVDIVFDGDDLEAFALHCAARAHIDIQEVGGSSLLALELLASEAVYWASDNGYANPLAAAAVGQFKLANGTAAAATFKFSGLYDSTA